MLSFGDIFRYREEYYIHLVHTSDAVYTAKILDPETTKRLIKLSDVLSKKSSNHADENPLLCFVVLTSDEFDGRAAHYGQEGMDSDTPREYIGKVNDADIETLKAQIKADKALKGAVRSAIGELFPD